MHAASTAMQIRKFSSPEIIFGPGAFDLLGRYAAQFRARRVLLVTDAGIRRAGWAGRAEELLRREGVELVVYERDRFQPQDQEIMAGANDYLRQRCSLVAAVGGGSVMDCAKGVCAVVGNARHILSLAGGEAALLPGPPLICAPSTPGSGADMSQFVILTDSRQGSRAVAVGRALIPSLTLVDPELAATLTPAALAGSGMDALSHAIEAYVSTAGSPLSEQHALEAVRILSEFLRSPAIDPSDSAQRNAAYLGGLHAGLAFSNAGLGLSHALAHALESLAGVEHTASLCWALPAAIRYNFSAVPERYASIGRALGASMQPQAVEDPEAEACRRLLDTLRALISKVQAAQPSLPAARLQDWPAKIGKMALSDVFIATNPIIPAPAAFERWLTQTMNDYGA